MSARLDGAVGLAWLQITNFVASYRVYSLYILYIYIYIYIISIFLPRWANSELSSSLGKTCRCGWIGERPAGLQHLCIYVTAGLVHEQQSAVVFSLITLNNGCAINMDDRAADVAVCVASTYLTSSVKSAPTLHRGGAVGPVTAPSDISDSLCESA